MVQGYDAGLHLFQFQSATEAPIRKDLADKLAGGIPNSSILEDLPNEATRGITDGSVFKDLAHEAPCGIVADGAIGEDDSSKLSRGIAKHPVD